MPFDPQHLRRVIDQVIESTPITPTEWSKRAGLSKNAVAEIRKNRTGSVTLRTLFKLAEAVDRSPAEFLNLEPEPAAALNRTTLDALLRLAERTKRVYASSAEDARNLEDLVRATVRLIRSRQADRPADPRPPAPADPEQLPRDRPGPNQAG